MASPLLGGEMRAEVLRAMTLRRSSEGERESGDEEALSVGERREGAASAETWRATWAVASVEDGAWRRSRTLSIREREGLGMTAALPALSIDRRTALFIGWC